MVVRNASARSGARRERRGLALTLDGLAAGLAAEGVTLRRSALVEVLARAGGLRDGNELAALAASGALTPERLESVGTADVGDVALVVGRDSRGRTFGVEPSLASERRYAVAPWGATVDLAGLSAPTAPEGRTVVATRYGFEVLSTDEVPGHYDIARILERVGEGVYALGSVTSSARVVGEAEAVVLLDRYGYEPSTLGLGADADEAVGDGDSGAAPAPRRSGESDGTVVVAGRRARYRVAGPLDADGAVLAAAEAAVVEAMPRLAAGGRGQALRCTPPDGVPREVWASLEAEGAVDAEAPGEGPATHDVEGAVSSCGHLVDYWCQYHGAAPTEALREDVREEAERRSREMIPRGAVTGDLCLTHLTDEDGEEAVEVHGTWTIRRR